AAGRVSCLALAPSPAGCGLERVAGVTALTWTSHAVLDYAPLVRNGRLAIVTKSPLQVIFLSSLDDSALKEKKVDLVLSAPDDFFALLEQSEDLATSAPPTIRVQLR